MIPILYEPSEAAFTSNGIARLRDASEVKVTEERNGEYVLDFSYPVDGAHFEEIIPGRIVAVTHDDSGDIQPFDIVSYSKPIDGMATFHGVHISYRQSFLTVVGQNINSLADAFDLLKNSSDPENPFTYETDKDSVGWFSGADGTPKTVRSLLGGSEGSILDCYGGEYEFDKFTVRLWKNRGETRDFTVRYGVNMTAYQDDSDYLGTFNSCIPFWNGEDGPVVGNKVDSNQLTYNGRDLCVPLDLTDKFETKPTVAQLDAAATTYLANRQPNLPHQNIKVDFLRLQDFSGYEEYEELMRCNLCDTIGVIFPKYGMTGTFKIVRTVWNVLENRYDEMELGALRTSLADALGISEGTVSPGGGSTPVYYGTCTTPAATQQKVATVDPDLTTLETGTLVFIKFTNTNSKSNPTLKVNNTAAKTIMRYGTTGPSTSAASSWNAGSVVAFVYDGTYWQMVGWINTTYSAMTQAEMHAGTSTTSRLMTPARLKEAILYWATPSNIGAMSSSAFVAGSYVYNSTSTSTITFQDANVNGKTHIICGCQDAGNPPLRASISGDTITVYLSSAVTMMRVNYICY